MGAIKLLKALRLVGLLNPRAIVRFLFAVSQNGINIMLLLSMGAFVHGEQIAIVSGSEKRTYRQLHSRSQGLACLLAKDYELKNGRKAAFLCRNHIALIESVFAASRTGASIYLLNPDMNQRQLDSLVAENGFDLLIHDEEFGELVSRSPFKKRTLLSYHAALPSIDQLSRYQPEKKERLKKTSGSRIVLLTGGTTGKPKQAVHAPSLFNFLPPFSELMRKLQLAQIRTAYIATPLFHGYGIAILFSLLALGKKVVIHDRFKADIACTLVQRHEVELMTAVPMMIAKMLQTAPEKMGTIRCIASGGAKLNPKLVSTVRASLGDVLYNLYGTSESGLNLIATPKDLNHNAATVGKSIKGGKLAVLENGHAKKRGEIGQLCAWNNWSMKNRKGGWIETGDLGYQDEKGYFYLCGRADDMIVSAGINIYPAEIEQALLSHPHIEDAAVLGIMDELYGESLTAFVQAVEEEKLTQEELKSWLGGQLPKYLIPRSFKFMDQLPYTDIGKLDKKALKQLFSGGEFDENGKREDVGRRSL